MCSPAALLPRPVRTPARAAINPGVVTESPAAPSDTRRSVARCDTRPIGRNSVVTRTNADEALSGLLLAGSFAAYSVFDLPDSISLWPREITCCCFGGSRSSNPLGNVAATTAILSVNSRSKVILSPFGKYLGAVKLVIASLRCADYHVDLVLGKRPI
jgi:hypothetical protein